MQQLIDIINFIDKSIKDDANNLVTWGNIIKDWYDSEIDELRSFVNN